LVLVHAKGKVRDRMRKVGLIEKLGSSGMYPSERIAVEALTEFRAREAAAASEAVQAEPTAAAGTPEATAMVEPDEDEG
jgi:hypothetical protein